MVKYKEGSAGIRGHKNQTIRNTKPDSSVSLSQASTSTTGSSSDKWSQTPPRWNSEGRDRCQQDYHLAPYFPVGPPMPGLWGPPPMMYPPYPPWVGWYGCRLCHQYTSIWDGQDLLRVFAMEASMQDTAVTRASATSRTWEPQGRKTGWSRTPNRRIRFPRK
jgi:hypothetical protein